MSSFFERNWSTAAPSLPISVLDCESGLDPSIATQPLRGIFALNRQLIEICRKPLPLDTKNGINANSCFLYIGSKSHVGMCRLVSHYLHLTESQTGHGSYGLSPGPTKGQLYTEATITLAAIYAIRLIGYEVKVNGMNIRDASPTILPHLRSNLNHALNHLNPSEHQHYQTAFLWIYYLGALSEQLASTKSAIFVDQSDYEDVQGIVSRQFYNRKLAQHAHKMNLWSWAEVRAILQGFIYSDNVEPHGSRWFYRIEGAYLDDRREC